MCAPRTLGRALAVGQFVCDRQHVLEFALGDTGDKVQQCHAVVRRLGVHELVEARQAEAGGIAAAAVGVHKVAKDQDDLGTSERN